MKHLNKSIFLIACLFLISCGFNKFKTGTDDQPNVIYPTVTLSLDGMNTVAIQTEFNKFQSGDIVQLEASGDIILDDKLVLNRDGVKINANGVHFKGGGFPLPDTIIEIAANDVTLENVRISNGAGDLLYMDTPHNNISLSNIVVHNSNGDDCLQLKGGSGHTIQNIVTYNCFGDGVTLAGISNAQVSNIAIMCLPEFPDCSVPSTSNFGGLNIYYSSGVTIDNVRISGGNFGNNGSAIRLFQNIGNITLSNSTITSNTLNGGSLISAAVNIYLEHHNDVVTLDNVSINGNTGRGITIEREVGYDPTVLIRNSSIQNNSAEALNLINTPTCNIQNNTISSNLDDSTVGCNSI